MKIAYVTPYASGDVHAWSGSVFHVREALSNAGGEIVPVDSLVEKGRYSGKLKEILYKKLTGKTYLRDRSPALLDGYASEVAARCKAVKPEVIFSPGTIPIAHLEPGAPVAFWTDATFAGITDYYAHFTNLCQRTIREGREMEQRALASCSLAIYTSDWAAKSAVENYNVDPAKVKVVPYGANVSSDRDEAGIRELVENRSSEVCELLFVGVDWERKGGPIALETAEILNRRGLKTRLHVVGCEPPCETPAFVVRHGFVSKKTAEGSALLDRLFSEAHFLIVPSRAECFGLVFAEASSFGLPSLAATTGGVPSVVAPGINGRLFPLEATGEAYAAAIEKIAEDPAAYLGLAMNSFAEFRSRLNWGVAGAEVMRLMKAVARP